MTVDVACIAPSDTFDYTQIFEDHFQERVSEDITLTGYKPHHGELPEEYDFDAVLVTGSGYHVYDHQDWEQETEDYLQEMLDRDVPVLGVCYGHQILAESLVNKEKHATDGAYNAVKPLTDNEDAPHDREMGYREVHVTEDGQESDLFDGIDDTFVTFESHMDYVDTLPDHTLVLAENEYGVQAFESSKYPAFGVQFHPEYDLDMANQLLDGKDVDQDTYEDIKATLTAEREQAAKESRKVFDNFLKPLL